MMFASAPSTVNQKAQPRSTIRRLLVACGNFLVPPGCVLCDAPGLAGPLDLCAACLAGLPRLAPVDAFESRAFARICCPWRFEFPIDEWVRALKFRGERTYARVFGTLLARERMQVVVDAEAAPLPHWVVPVPLHPRRLRERGYNQAAELARFAARSLALPLDLTLLQRSRATKGQTGLGVRERALNVAGAFVTTRTLHHAPRLALVDDVVTTGSTVLAAAAALHAAGAGAVELWVVARARRLSRALEPADLVRESAD
jgi:ComF family protein